jgi:hypothetical protein
MIDLEFRSHGTRLKGVRRCRFGDVGDTRGTRSRDQSATMHGTRPGPGLYFNAYGILTPMGAPRGHHVRIP